MHILKSGTIGNRLHQIKQMNIGGIGRIGKDGIPDAHPRLATIGKNGRIGKISLPPLAPQGEGLGVRNPIPPGMTKGRELDARVLGFYTCAHVICGAWSRAFSRTAGAHLATE